MAMAPGSHGKIVFIGQQRENAHMVGVITCTKEDVVVARVQLHQPQEIAGVHQGNVPNPIIFQCFIQQGRK